MTAVSAGRNMHDRTGWHAIECGAVDQIRHAAQGVSSSLTDPDGNYGQAVIYTEWMDADGRPTLRDYRWPHDDRPCEHLVPDSEVQS